MLEIRPCVPRNREARNVRPVGSVRFRCPAPWRPAAHRPSASSPYRTMLDCMTPFKYRYRSPFVLVSILA